MTTHPHIYTIQKRNTDINIHTNSYKQTHIIRTLNMSSTLLLLTLKETVIQSIYTKII